LGGFRFNDAARRFKINPFHDQQILTCAIVEEAERSAAALLTAKRCLKTLLALCF
jgi:hypothetical protein